MKPAAFEYHRPESLEQALSMLAADDADTKVIAGGQSLGPMMNLRLARPRVLIDVSRLPELRAVDAGPEETVIGASVTHAEIEDGCVALGAGHGPEVPILASVAARIAYRAVRNRGTVGGSLAHADPAADWPAALLAAGAEVRVQATGRSRRVALGELLRGAYQADLEAGELIAAIVVPRPSEEARWGYYKISRKVGEFPHAIGAVLIDPPRRLCRVVAGAIGGAPVALHEAAAATARAAASPGLDAIKSELRERVPPVDDAKLHMAAVSVQRALDRAIGRALH